MLRTAVLPGSYDPITCGHLHIIGRTSALYDRVTVLLIPNAAKKYRLSVEKRLLLIQDAVKPLPNVSVDIAEGMLVDYVAAHDYPVIVKGVRNETDFAYEQNMAFYNRELSRRKYGNSAETLLMPPDTAYANISSTLVRTLYDFGSDISDLVPNAKLFTDLMKSEENA